jgi:hypothetical protein
MRTNVIIESALLLVLCVGCNSDRITKLEKENQELKEKLPQETANRDDDQMKCLGEARTFFEAKYKRDKSTTFMNYMNHFNRAQNACYIVVEWRANNAPFGSTSSTSLWDTQKNSRVGVLFANHSPDGKDSVSTCVVNGVSCKTPDEFNKLIQPFMNN